MRLRRKAEAVARALGWKDEVQLPSRAAMGMVDKLLDAARQSGHSFLTWEQLQAQTLAHLNAGASRLPLPLQFTRPLVAKAVAPVPLYPVFSSQIAEAACVLFCCSVREPLPHRRAIASLSVR